MLYHKSDFNNISYENIALIKKSYRKNRTKKYIIIYNYIQF